MMLRAWGTRVVASGSAFAKVGAWRCCCGPLKLECHPVHLELENLNSSLGCVTLNR